MMLDNQWRKRPEVEAALSKPAARFAGHPHLFPNLWFMPSVMQASLRLPKGPQKTEIWWFTYYYESMPPEERAETVRRCVRHNGPAGMFELDDGENWGESTHGNGGVGVRNYPLNYSLNIGHSPIIRDEESPPHAETLVNEHGQLWHYRAWAEWMAAGSWQDLRANHSAVPDAL